MHLPLSFLFLYLANLAQSLAPIYQHQTPLQQDQSITTTTSTSIRDSLLSSAIIPEVLNDFQPIYSIALTWPKKHKVDLGNKIKVKHVQERPVFTIHEIEDENGQSGLSPQEVRLGKTYTLVLTDPDATSRQEPKWSEMCHWIVTNLTTPLPGSPPTKLDLSFDIDVDVEEVEGELVEYKPPGPPPKTGAHRYVFVLLEGDTADVQPPKERKHWGYGKVRHGVRDWAEENGLTVVGANYFYAKNKKQ